MPGGGVIGGAATGAAAGSVAGPIGAIAGGLIGAAGSFFSGKSAQDNAKENYKKRYQWQVQDMKKAGLNPMLAFSQGAPNVPQAAVPDWGDAATKGAGVGSAVALNKQQVAANVNQMNASAAASTAGARKSNAEALILETGGSARQSAEIVESGARTSSLIANVDKVATEIEGLKTTNAQLEYMLKLERDVKAATARNLEAGIPPKLLLAEVAKIGTELIQKLQTPATRSAASSMLKDTVNMLQDKAAHGARAVSGLVSGYKDFMRKHGSAYR